MATAGEPLPQTASAIGFEIEASGHDDGFAVFNEMRPRLFAIAYRMLENAAEAEDIVQDVWLRWQSANQSAVENPSAFLAKTTTRLCINLAQAAHSRRETCIGTWLPEPVDTSDDPGLCAERGESLKFAILILLEKLSPMERATFILREAFDYSYRQIADILQLEEANVRQLACRARKHLAHDRRTSASSEEQQRFLKAFIAAARRGDMAGLEARFIEDVVSHSDRGGVARPDRAPDPGNKRVPAFIATRDVVMSRAPQARIALANDVPTQQAESASPRSLTMHQPDDRRLKKTGTGISANLVIVHSNPQPNRERHYPDTWLVYSQGQELQVRVERDGDYRPHVLDRSAA